MNKQVTSKQEILEACRAIVAELGVHALNMRNVAKRCDVAVGSLYNYFSSKDDLMTQVVESIWEEIVFRDFDRSEQSDFFEIGRRSVSKYQHRKPKISALFDDAFDEYRILGQDACKASDEAIFFSDRAKAAGGS